MEKEKLTFEEFKKSILKDYRIVVESREASLLGRKEVLTGKAKFGIFGDGKELAQIAMAKVFRNGDFRAGYYRDQPFMTAIGQYSPKHMFSALYGDPELDREPSSGSRQMMNHFSTSFLNDDRYFFPTLDITYDISQASYPKEPYVSFLDHILVSKNLFSDSYNVQTIKLDKYMGGFKVYENYISDHLPVLLSFD